MTRGRPIVAISALGVAVIVLASCRAGRAAREPTMQVLHIHLQEGFRNERVVVTVRGRVVFDQTVTTHLMHGFAASFETPVPRGPVDVEVRVGSNGLANRVTIDVQKPTHLGAGIRGGVVEFRVLAGPPPYG